MFAGRRGAGANQPGRRHRRLCGRGSRAASGRGRQARGRAHDVFQRADRRQRGTGRRLREEIRHQGQPLSGELGGDPPARAGRSRCQALRRRFHPQQRPRHGGDGGREAFGRGEIPLSRRRDAARDPAAPGVGRLLPQCPGAGLQYRPHQEGRAAEELCRSARSALEGPDRHRGRRFRLVRRPDGASSARTPASSCFARSPPPTVFRSARATPS